MDVIPDGRVDILVNNAAVQRPGTILEATLDDFDAVVNVNLEGPGCSAWKCSPA